jgi:hypothetical protein
MLRFQIVDRATATGHPLGAMEVTGDHGGHTYFICEASRVRAKDAVLRRLAMDLDALISRRGDEDEVVVRWIVTNRWDEWTTQEPGLWVWSKLLKRGVEVPVLCDVLAGRLDRLVPPPPSTSGSSSG